MITQPHDSPPAAPAGADAAVASAFAAALDRGDLAAAARMLAPDCECRDGGLLARGDAAVIAIYRAAASWSERGFDDVRQASEVESAAAGRARVAVTTMLMRMPGRWHRLRHARELAIGADGRITGIVHVCDPAAASAFRAFVQVCGVPPPPPGLGV